MRILEGIRLALAQIRAQKLKSFFALIGVFIGVMLLVTVVSVVEGMNRYMEEDFAKMVWGLNTAVVRRMPSVQMDPSPAVWREWRRRPRLRVADADAVRARLSMPALVAVASMSGGNAVADDGTEVTNVMLSAVSADYFRIRELEIDRGRLFSAAEDRTGAAVVVLGRETVDMLFGIRDPLGRTIRIGGFPFRVIGILEKQGSLFGMSLDNQAIAPARSPMARLVNPHGVVDEIVVRTENPAALDQAMMELESIMRARRQLRPAQPNNFEVETAEDSMSFWTRISRILYIAFPGLVAIALVVGGMVIMNIMLVSVTERTREIGVRKAIGARRHDIIIQVLVESATLSGVGAVLGIGFGIVLAWIVRTASPLPAVIAPIWILVAAALGIGVGVVAGLYPAARASRLDPVVALRYE
jgi:putative ABC transport system permease protein